ncbi:lytic polysaccharide monooxygenase auxiliary activity family 9 protein [Actinomadura atramentaria]|uniref:lytic polysaccharide monooxygenase auxiliary activity family 9 protein n=1 Tax=Actinomadura atramentaria TaxID=1990 RepID=UPI00036CB5C1|nr:lytic polysaccharide monooxygenase [Actinomadura atramentaria]
MKTRSTSFRHAVAAVALTAAPVAVLTVPASPALAHGSMQTPASRALTCYLENPESPRTAACKAAVRAGGTQPFYDWNGVRRGDAAGRHRQLIPDGKLCSAGNPEFRGLDLARADWPATALKSGAAYTFRYKATAPHQGGFQFYVTKDGYDPRKPLAWSDLEGKPFLTVPSPALSNGFYNMSGRLPAGKSGRHLIYAIWQRTDSPEAFYSCSDVVFGGKSGTAPAPARTPSATTPKPSRAHGSHGTPVPAVCPPPATGHQHGGTGANVALRNTAADNGPRGSGGPLGTTLLTGTLGLTLGGIGGLLLTGRRRRPARED